MTDAPASTVSATVGNVGSYEVGGLAPGIYTVTATYGRRHRPAAVGPVTVLVTVGVNPELARAEPIVLALDDGRGHVEQAAMSDDLVPVTGRTGPIRVGVTPSVVPVVRGADAVVTVDAGQRRRTSSAR